MLLGKKTIYLESYNKEILYRILREDQRKILDINIKSLPFKGYDIWNIYEVSWLDDNGKPVVAIGKLSIPADSAYLIESKSLKLYFNSFNNENFSSKADIEKRIKEDLEEILNCIIGIKLYSLSELTNEYKIVMPKGVCLDNTELENITYNIRGEWLNTDSSNIVEESVYSNLLRSNCLITNQPDWATILIEYKGPKIDHASLLKYIISYRNHNEFHEHCVERIFVDIMKECKPEYLTVYARYTRRGGIDINPYRTNKENFIIENNRFIRQ